MSRRYSVAHDVAWVDGTAGGRAEPVVWVARVPDGAAYELRGPAWLVWTAIAYGRGATTAELPRRIAQLGGPEGVPASDLEPFLDELVDRGLCDTDEV
jgi:hypothetical protein